MPFPREGTSSLSNTKKKTTWAPLGSDSGFLGDRQRLAAKATNKISSLKKRNSWVASKTLPTNGFAISTRDFSVWSRKPFWNSTKIEKYIKSVQGARNKSLSHIQAVHGYKYGSRKLSQNFKNTNLSHRETNHEGHEVKRYSRLTI